MSCRHDWAGAIIKGPVNHILVDQCEKCGKLRLQDAAPPAQGIDLGQQQDAARWRYIRRKLCLNGNGNGACSMQAINLPSEIPGWPETGEVAEFCDIAIDAAMQATSAEVGA